MSDKTNIEKLDNTNNLTIFLEQNKDVDFVFCDLQDEKTINKLNFNNFRQKQKEIVLQLKAYQRLIRIIPEKYRQTALLLMQQGIHSALQIAAQTRKDFMGMCSGLLNKDVAINDQLSATIYQNAQEKRSAILVQYMDILQNNEPHISTTRFN